MFRFQVAAGQSKGTNASFPDAWSQGLADAVKAAGTRSPGLQIAVEEREDLLVEADDRRSPAPVVHSRLRGLCATGPFESGGRSYLSDPHPGDASSVLRGALSGTIPAGDSRPSANGVAEPRLDVEAAVESVRRVIDAAMKLRPEAAVRARRVVFEQRILLVRADGEQIADVRRGSRIRLEAHLSTRAASAAAVGESADGGQPDPQATEELVRSLMARLEQRIDARPLPSGPRRVVFAPGTGGILVHELVGHALEADAGSGPSWLAEAGDAAVASTGLTVIDDPRRGRARWRYDDDGERARPVALIREGRVTGRIHDLRSARVLGHAPTGHGRRSSFREPIRPRMGCTFVAAGRQTTAEVFEDLRDAIYVRRMEVADVDPRVGRGVFRVTDADQIVDGRIAGPLTPHLLRIDGRAALSTVDRIADDLAFDRCVGSCLRHGQPLAVSVGGPTFRIGLTSAQF